MKRVIGLSLPSCLGTRGSFTASKHGCQKELQPIQGPSNYQILLYKCKASRANPALGVSESIAAELSCMIASKAATRLLLFYSASIAPAVFSSSHLLPRKVWKGRWSIIHRTDLLLERLLSTAAVAAARPDCVSREFCVSCMA